MLTAKQQRFVDEYMVDLNAKQAAIRAGYSARSAEQNGSRMLRNDKVAAEVAKRQAKVAEKLELTQEMVRDELRKLAFSNMLDYMRAGPDGDPYLDFSQLTRDQAAALAEVTVEDFKDGRGEEARDVRRIKFKLSDKRASLMDLAKLCGFVTEKHEHSGPGGGPMKLEHIKGCSDEELLRELQQG